MDRMKGNSVRLHLCGSCCSRFAICSSLTGLAFASPRGFGSFMLRLLAQSRPSRACSCSRNLSHLIVMFLVHFFQPLKDVRDDAMAFASQIFC